jgi:hypothetical protein
MINFEFDHLRTADARKEKAQLINQSINQSIKQSINQLIYDIQAIG